MRLRIDVLGLTLLDILTGEHAARLDEVPHPGPPGDVGSHLERRPSEDADVVPDPDDRIGFRATGPHMAFPAAPERHQRHGRGQVDASATATVTKAQRGAEG